VLRPFLVSPVVLDKPWAFATRWARTRIASRGSGGSSASAVEASFQTEGARMGPRTDVEVKHPMNSPPTNSVIIY
jgi:hypothetical protein